jgi:hypothetical protein
MEIKVKGQTKTINIGDSIKLVTGEIAKVTGDFGGGLIVRTDMDEIKVVEAKDIVDIIVMIVKELGLVERFIAWSRFLLNDKKKGK